MHFRHLHISVINQWVNQYLLITHLLKFKGASWGLTERSRSPRASSSSTSRIWRPRSTPTGRGSTGSMRSWTRPGCWSTNCRRRTGWQLRGRRIFCRFRCEWQSFSMLLWVLPKFRTWADLLQNQVHKHFLCRDRFFPNVEPERICCRNRFHMIQMTKYYSHSWHSFPSTGLVFPNFETDLLQIQVNTFWLAGTTSWRSTSFGRGLSITQAPDGGTRRQC